MHRPLAPDPDHVAPPDRNARSPAWTPGHGEIEPVRLHGFRHLRYHGPLLGEDALAALAEDVTALMAETMGKRADLTAVLAERVEPGFWAVGGAGVERAAHLAAAVTAGTNTPAQKAAFVAAAHALLERTFGPGLALGTYVVIAEVEAGSWGYGGRTQESRRVPPSGEGA